MLYQFEMIKTDENLPRSVDITVYKQVYHLKPGDILTINPNHIHSTNSDDLNTAAYILHIPFTYMQYCYPDIKTLEFDTYDHPPPKYRRTPQAVRTLL